jgi:hypothetical protein
MEKVNTNHLYWIVPAVFIIGYLFGLYLNIPAHIDVTLDYGPTFNATMETVLAVQNISRTNATIKICELVPGKGWIQEEGFVRKATS